MTYADFTLETVEAAFGLDTDTVPLFPDLAPLDPPGWLVEALARAGPLARRNEKARSEFLIAPVLLAARQLAGGSFTIFSGQPFVVDPDDGLTGECDFILAAVPESPLLRAPLVTVVEAKRTDIDLGLGQAVAQMVGATRFNARRGQSTPAMFGCVTTGEDWQLVRLVGTALRFDSRRYYIDDLGRVLAALVAAVAQARGQAQ